MAEMRRPLPAPGAVVVRDVSGAVETESELEIDPASVQVTDAGPGRLILETGAGPIRAVVGGPRARTRATTASVEVVVDGWRFELEVENGRTAALRQWATRRDAASAAGGRSEIRAIIPGRIAAVSVVAGDAVVAGQTLLVIEAMKMQNELRAPRDGRVESVDVGVGETIDLGRRLVVLA
jgi:biotin carboxyl carrier protein